MSRAEEEIEAFEKLFLFPLETSFDDSGYDPGSVVDEKECKEEGINDEKSIQKKEKKEKYQHTNNGEISSTSNALSFSPIRASPPLLPTSSDSDCDSGAFSRSSTPTTNTLDRDATLESPSMVLAVVKETANDNTAENNKTKSLNPDLLKPCQNKAGRNSFSSLDNLSNITEARSLKNISSQNERLRIFKNNPKSISRPHPTYEKIKKEVNKDYATRDIGGSLGELYWKRRDIETWTSETNLRFSNSRRLQQQDICEAESEAWRTRKDKINQCLKGCNTQVTVNGQHICSFS